MTVVFYKNPITEDGLFFNFDFALGIEVKILYYHPSRFGRVVVKIEAESPPLSFFKKGERPNEKPVQRAFDPDD